jgi:hypothetical protein
MDAQASLQSLLHIGGVSRTGLCEILERIRKTPDLPPHDLRRKLSAAEHARFESVKIIVPLTLKNGRTFEWEFADPKLLVPLVIAASESLQRVYSEAAEWSGSSAEWRMIIGFDEYVPGCKFDGNNQRKCMNVYFNFLDLGKGILCHDCTWFVPISVRTSMIKQVEGGWSYMLRIFLRVLLLSDGGFGDLTGVPLLVQGRLLSIRANVRIIISDGDGIRQALDWRGYNSLTPCFRHWNCVSRSSGLQGGGLFSITHTDHRDFQLASSTFIQERLRILVAASERHAIGAMTNAKFEQMQQAIGYHGHPRSVLMDKQLHDHFDIISTFRYDPMHSFLQDGVLNTAMNLLLQASHDIEGVSFADYEAYFNEPWIYPKFSDKGSSARVFVKHRYAADTTTLKCNAGEMIGIYAMLRHFVR